jgi:hypothetical protein
MEYGYTFENRIATIYRRKYIGSDFVNYGRYVMLRRNIET